MKTGQIILIAAVLGVIAYLVYRAKNKTAPASTLWNPLQGIQDETITLGTAAGTFVDDLFSNYEFAPDDDGGVMIPTM
jgi:hypothetical protein